MFARPLQRRTFDRVFFQCPDLQVLFILFRVCGSLAPEELLKSCSLTSLSFLAYAEVSLSAEGHQSPSSHSHSHAPLRSSRSALSSSCSLHQHVVEFSSCMYQSKSICERLCVENRGADHMRQWSAVWSSSQGDRTVKLSLGIMARCSKVTGRLSASGDNVLSKKLLRFKMECVLQQATAPFSAA